MPELFGTVEKPRLVVPSEEETIDYITRSQIEGVDENRSAAEDYWHEELKKAQQLFGDLALNGGIAIMRATAEQQPTVKLLNYVSSLPMGAWAIDGSQEDADWVDGLQNPDDQPDDYTGAVIIPHHLQRGQEYCARYSKMNELSKNDRLFPANKMQEIVDSDNGEEPFASSDHRLVLPTMRHGIDRFSQDPVFRYKINSFDLQVYTTSKTMGGNIAYIRHGMPMNTWPPDTTRYVNTFASVVKKLPPRLLNTQN
jgi:hypothetical protein